MSTRSGKRIHSSFLEETDSSSVMTNQRKTRCKRFKENDSQLDVTLPKSSKLNNYSSYPADDETSTQTCVTVHKRTRQLRRKTLKDHNFAAPLAEDLDSDIEVKKAGRQTRRTRKFNEDFKDALENADCVETNLEKVTKKKIKRKNYKKKSKDVTEAGNEMVNGDIVSVPIKKSKCKKKDSHGKVKKNKSLIKSATSTESFYSAASSSVEETSIRNSVNNEPDGNPGICDKPNTTFEEIKRKSSMKNTTFDKIKSPTSSFMTLDLNSTFDKKDSSMPIQKLNRTYVKEAKVQKPEPPKDTFNNALDKPQSQSYSVKSSLISSDGTVNATFDKSYENSCISFTSDDDVVMININTTPLLIESSMYESPISKNQSNTESCNLSSKESVADSKAPENKTPSIIREGTYTLDSPVFPVSSLKLNSPMEKTPTVPITLPSQDCTPFSHSSQKEKSLLNAQRSSSKKLMPRKTKVMFCSPVNNSTVTMQQKRKVIKSSMKGSNRSFEFDESERRAGREAAAGARKRSLTQNDAEEARAHAKRTRLTPDAQLLSANRLSRPRTSSAAAKLSGATPTTKPAPASASKSSAKPARTKLPNFAALHQRRFDKMESLGDCQERKRKRARQLLSPTGRVVVLERSSPRGITLEPLKESSRTPKKQPATHKETTINQLMTLSTTLPTFESLRPGYTRFGFKINIDVNPFNVPHKTETKPKENKPNGLPKAPVKPSLIGATSSRKEVAKQTVMREKSFTSLSGKSDLTRKENRTFIKGVRTNRRFELQMKMRDIN